MDEGDVDLNDDKHFESIRIEIKNDINKTYEDGEINDVGNDSLTEKVTELTQAIGISLNGVTHDAGKLYGLFESLDVTLSTFQNYRFEAIHVRGVERMTTEDIFEYFRDYDPSSIDWLTAYSCNVVWSDKQSALKCLMTMSKRIIGTNQSSKQNEDAINVSDINAPVPSGYWRYGEPHLKSKSIFMRVALHTDKKQKTVIEKSDGTERTKKVSDNFPTLSSDKLIDDDEAMDITIENDENRHVNGKNGTDKNPWGELAEKWSGVNKIRSYTPEPIEIIHMREEPQIDTISIPESPTMPSIKDRVGRKRRNSSVSNSSDEVVGAKPKKVKIRMKMYADDEEKRVKAMKSRKVVAIKTSAREVKEKNHHFSVDLRNKLSTKPSRKLRSRLDLSQQTTHYRAHPLERRDEIRVTHALEHIPRHYLSALKPPTLQSRLGNRFESTRDDEEPARNHGSYMDVYKNRHHGHGLVRISIPNTPTQSTRQVSRKLSEIEHFRSRDDSTYDDYENLCKTSMLRIKVESRNKHVPRDIHRKIKYPPLARKRNTRDSSSSSESSSSSSSSSESSSSESGSSSHESTPVKRKQVLSRVRAAPAYKDIKEEK